MKAHIGVDAHSGLVHTETTTAANEADVEQFAELLHGKEKFVYADSGYGIHIIHGMDLERLARRCAELQREDFLLTANALYLPQATGSPLTPVAIL